MYDFEKLDKQDMINILVKCWMTHDGMWFYNSFNELGIEKANKLNKAAISSLAPFEIGRFKKLLKIDQVRTYDDIKFFFSEVARMLIPDFMNFVWEFSEDKTISWGFSEDKTCFAYNGMCMIGIAEQYECGPIHRIKSWLDTIGVEYRITPDVGKCMMPKEGKCKGTIVFHNM